MARRNRGSVPTKGAARSTVGGDEKGVIEGAQGARHKLFQRVMPALRILIPLILLGYLLSVVSLRDTLVSL